MYIGKLTSGGNVEDGFVLDASRPILAYEAEVDYPLCPAAHEHPRGQLIYASIGIIRVITEKGVWTVPPLQAVWIPALMTHSVDFPGRTLLNNLFFDPSVLNHLPGGCFVLRVSPLLRELILRFCHQQSPEKRLNMSKVIIDEINDADEEPLSLPTSKNPYLTQVIDSLTKNPADRRTLDELASESGMSPRNFARVFVKETGMTFGAWRTRLKLLCALEMLDGGKSVTETAFDLGYQSISAFIETFRKEMGVSPLKYVRAPGGVTVSR